MSSRSGQPSSGGRGHGHPGRGHGGRTRPGRGGSRQRNHRPNQATNRPTTKFQGQCEALKDYTFDCSDYKQADRYVNTVKRISEYVGSEYKNGGDIRSSIVNETKFKVPIPTAPNAPADPANPTIEETTKSKLYERRLDAVVKREGMLDDNIQRLYSLVLGQCTDLLQSKLKQQANWDTVSGAQVGIELLKLIKTVVYKFEDQKFLPLALYNAKNNLYFFC